MPTQKTLILRSNVDEYFFPLLKGKYNIYPVYQVKRPYKFFFEKIASKYSLLRLPFLGEWKLLIKNYSHIVIFDTGYSREVTQFIKKNNKTCVINLFFFNKIETQYQRNMLHDKNVDYFWSFDHGDVKKYSLHYNSTFFIEGLFETTNKCNYDITFLARAKNRKEEIMKVEQECNRLGLKTNFHVISNEKDYINYFDYCKMVSCSRAILDITKKGQEGLSLRFMEALFGNKKIITNNSNITHYDFYKSQNVFVLGVDNIEDMPEFIKSPVLIVSDKIKFCYKFDNWLKRFYEV